MTSDILKEEDEPGLSLEEHNYKIKSVLTEGHSKDTIGHPVIVFDRWKILQSDIPDQQETQILEEAISPPQVSATGNNSNRETFPLTPLGFEVEELTSSSEELSSYAEKNLKTMSQPGETETAQKTQSSSVNDLKACIVRKPRPNSLAITSLSLDLTSLPSTTSTSDKEVSSKISATQCLSVSSVNVNFEPSRVGLASTSRSASADALIETRPGLQQRRNKSARPSSLQIPSILHIPPPPVRTADQLSSRQHFTFNR